LGSNDIYVSFEDPIPRTVSPKYVVTLFPGGLQVEGTSSPLYIQGLQPNASYFARLSTTADGDTEVSPGARLYHSNI
jgi:hypothetical protein